MLYSCDATCATCYNSSAAPCRQTRGTAPSSPSCDTSTLTCPLDEILCLFWLFCRPATTSMICCVSVGHVQLWRHVAIVPLALPHISQTANPCQCNKPLVCTRRPSLQFSASHSSSTSIRIYTYTCRDQRSPVRQQSLHRHTYLRRCPCQGRRLTNSAQVPSYKASFSAPATTPSPMTSSGMPSLSPTTPGAIIVVTV